MPLKAIYNSQPIYSFNCIDDESWAQLKLEYRHGQLLTSCCRQPAIPRTSPTGTPHFAHKTKGHCESRSETREHLLVKHKLALIAQDQGWRARTEEAGAAPDGEKWIADVFCEKGKARVAFEVQLASQSDEETLYRQLRYRRSGVRAAWFVKYSARREQQGQYLVRQDVPLFAIDVTETGEVFLPQFGVYLEEFVTGMLSGGLTWVPAQEVERIATFQFFLADQSCHHCRHNSKVLMATRFRLAGGTWVISNFTHLKQLKEHDFYQFGIIENLFEKPFSTSWQQLCPNCRKVIHSSSFGDERQFLKELEHARSTARGIKIEQADALIAIGQDTEGYWELKSIAK